MGQCILMFVLLKHQRFGWDGHDTNGHNEILSECASNILLYEHLPIQNTM